MNVKNKFNLYIILSAAFIVILIVGLALRTHKGTYSLDDELNVTITCPEAVTNGYLLTCDVFLNNVTEPILSVNANYDFKNISSGDIEFTTEEECGGDSCFQEFVSTDNGFAVINQEGITSDVKIGTISFLVIGEYNNSYDMELTNIELCDSNYEIISLADASSTVRIKNVDAKLTNIEIDKTPLEENFDDENDKYTATIADNGEETDTVTLTLTKSDEFATINGETENLELHYGKNTFTIEVVSEDEYVTKEYVVEITRQFDFDPDNSEYVYNSEDNYIYIKNDPLDTFHNNLKTLPENMAYHINDGKLEILYEEEVIKSIDILRFVSSYLISDNEIYIEGGLKLGQLKSKITSDVLTIKYFDNNNNELLDDDDEIQNNDKIKVYYEETELGSYSINFEYLNIDSSLVLDSDKEMLKRVSLGTTYGELKSMISTSGVVTLTNDANDVIINNDYKIISGDKIEINLGDKTLKYTLSVVGCLDREEEVTLSDVINIYRHLKHRIELKEEYAAAGDITNDGSIGLDDVIIMYRYLKGRINTLENGGGM